MDGQAAQRLADEFGIPRVYADYMEMLEKETPDIVSVCTTNFTHKPVILAALKAGSSVHLEKPIALNAAEAAEVAAAEKASGRKVMFGLNKRSLGQTIMA